MGKFFSNLNVLLTGMLLHSSLGLKCGNEEMMWTYVGGERRVAAAVEPLLTRNFVCTHDSTQTGVSNNVSFQLSLCNQSGAIQKLEKGKPTVVLGAFSAAHFSGDVTTKRVFISYQPETYDCAKEKNPDPLVIVTYRQELSAECTLVRQRDCQFVFLLQTPDFAGANVQPTVSAVTSSETLKTTPSAAIADTTVTGEAKPTKDNHISGFVATLIAVSLLFVCYFVFGAMYKRVVLGAQGVEQIPNYLFWRRCCRRVQAWSDQWRGGERPGHESYRHYADDLSYDQPPLTVSVSTGNDYNPVISHSHSRTPDEADERLIQP